MSIGIGNAPGKIILMGEHSVVYGKQSIALPFYSVGVKCTVLSKKGPLKLDSSCFNGNLDLSSNEVKGLKTLIEKTLEYLKKEKKNLAITIESTIPPQRGLGSSAAVSVAVVRALFDYFKVDLNKETLNKLVFVAESIHHNNPSGLDANTIISERLLLFSKEEGIKFIASKINAFLVVADTGLFGNTKESVSQVKKLMDENKDHANALIDELGDATNKSLITLKNNDVKTLGKHMSKAHFLLRELGISNETLDLYVDISMKNGAYGAKLTGGGNGGCMIAITDSIVDAKNISNALINEGAAHAWIYHLNEVSNNG